MKDGTMPRMLTAVEPDHSSRRDTIPLCVDLDGTLVKTDMLLESLLLLLKARPLFLFLVPFWLLKGRACLKERIAQRVTLDVACLPYNLPFLAFLREQHRAGRPLVLITASDMAIARPIANHLGLFAEVFASNGKTNLRGSEKLKVLRKNLGGKDFDYAGDSRADLEIWHHARQSILVGGTERLHEQLRSIAPACLVFPNQENRLKASLRSLRLHQWAKNALIFVPLLVSHQFTNFKLLADAIWAFVAFSLCASSVYVLNDLVDLEADRHHPNKKHRPFAAGDLPATLGMAMVPVLLVGSLAVARWLPLSFVMMLGLYYVLTLAYSLRLKRVVLVDVIVLASLYTIRIFAGAQATGVVLSSWLVQFSMFFFLSLALLKRFSELHKAAVENRESFKGRGYSTAEIQQLVSMGVASGYMAVLVLGFYVSSREVAILYASPEMLWLLCPALLYWINRAWLIGHRGLMNDDPVVFALRDQRSYWIGILVAVVMFLSKYDLRSLLSGS
jgi:4-hydroxybenzoate polyprenyltransferase